MRSIKKRNIVIVLCVIILLAVLVIVLLWAKKNWGGRQGEALMPVKQEQKDAVSVTRTDTVIGDTELVRAPAPAKTPTQRHSATVARTTAKPHVRNIDSSEINGVLRSTEKDTAPDETHCRGDTAAPWVYPDPSGGLHRQAVKVIFGATKPCAIEWKTDSTAAGEWKTYRGDTITIEVTTTLFFRAHDSCGNRMEERDERYEIQTAQVSKYCPEDMEYIKVGATRFCIDRYEWPNKKKAQPLSFISIYSAMDSCVCVGKRLCASDEWTLACTGPYGWKYPYGAVYEPRACVSHDTTARPSGSKPECRGFFEVYDMAGNCAEWTNTRSNRNTQFYNVKGGFWESGPHSSCHEVHYSYYPQNRHNPVGFRCCKDAAQQ
jgi:hypothetical protein